VTKRDFELIAEILREWKAGPALVEAFATKLQESNQIFDPEKFCRAATIMTPDVACSACRQSMFKRGREYSLNSDGRSHYDKRGRCRPDRLTAVSIDCQCGCRSGEAERD